MENRFDKTPIKFTQKKISRRVLLKSIGKTLLAVGGIGVVGGAVLKNIDRIKENEDRYSVERLFGEPIEEEEPKNFVTDRYGENDLIIVRKNPVLSDGQILGYTSPGKKITARAVYGAQYGSYDSSLGGPVMKDGEGYGKWYEINGDDLDIFNPAHIRIDSAGKKVYMAGNFLRVLKDNEADK